MELKITPKKFNRMMKKAHQIQKPNKKVEIANTKINEGYIQAKVNLESRAESMDPKAYIDARNYLADLEMSELIQAERL